MSGNVSEARGVAALRQDRAHAHIPLPSVTFTSHRSDGDETPLERLRHRGLRSLSDAEVVALLLSAGREDAGDLTDAREVLRDGGLAGLLRLDESYLRRCGLGESRAGAILAGVELGRRLARVRLPEGQPLKRPDLAADYLILRYQGCDQEITDALYLDVRERLIVERELFRGTLTEFASDYQRRWTTHEIGTEFEGDLFSLFCFLLVLKSRDIAFSAFNGRVEVAMASSIFPSKNGGDEIDRSWTPSGSDSLSRRITSRESSITVIRIVMLRVQLLLKPE